MAPKKTAATKAAPGKVSARRRGVTTDELLLETAEQLFARYGYEGVSTKQLAAAAGVTIGALYHYFPSKEAIYEEVARRTFAQKDLLPDDVLAPTEPPEKQLASQVAWFVRSIVTDPQFGMLMQRELMNPRSGTPDLLLKQRFEQPYKRFHALLDELIPHADKDAAFAAMLALCFGFASLKGIYALAPNVSQTLRTPEDIAQYATGLLLHGLQAPGQPRVPVKVPRSRKR